MLGQRPHSVSCFHAASIDPIQQLEDGGGGAGWLAGQARVYWSQVILVQTPRQEEGEQAP
jgi:hypothetical protein